MRISSDDHYVITAGRDGCILVFEIKDKDARGIRLKEGYTKESEEILVTKQDLEDLRSIKENLRLTLGEYTTQQSISNINMKDEEINSLVEKIKRSQYESEKTYALLEEEIRALKQKQQEEFRALKERFEQEIEETDTEQQKNIMKQVEVFENDKRLLEIANNQNIKKKLR